MGAKMRKLVLFIGLAFCLVSAETGYTAQEAFCGGESLSKCISHYQKQCNDKNYAVCGIVGNLEEYGNENYKEAKKYYQTACKKTNIEATYQIKQIDNTIDKMSGIFIAQLSCKLLGHLYYRGNGMKQDIDKAIQYYKKSCDLGDNYACGHIGFIYYKKEDFKRAKDIFAKSCEKLEGNSCGLLAEMYTNGKGVKKDLSKAKELYGKACDLGSEINGCFMYKVFNEMNIK